LDRSEIRSEIPGKFSNVMPEKDGEDVLTDRMEDEEAVYRVRRKEMSRYNEKEEG
jgi:hypothetical protein